MRVMMAYFSVAGLNLILFIALRLQENEESLSVSKLVNLLLLP